MQLEHLMDLTLLREMVDDGYVRRQTHPEYGYVILNYTQKAQFENVWNDTTRNCRGLIYDPTNGQKVLARPFPKFFNYGQPEAPDLRMDDPVVVHDKLDGSLGILYPTPDGPAIATRGSFTSEQALRATRILREHHKDWVENEYRPHSELTYLFEIIYPENRVVLDYGELEDLVFLGAVGGTGPSYYPPRGLDWYGFKAEEFPYRTLKEVLEAPPRENAEGLAVYVPRVRDFVKIKQEDYVRLHKIVTNLSARSIWEGLVAGQTPVEISEPIPDEWHPWVGKTAEGLIERFKTVMDDVYDMYYEILQTFDETDVDRYFFHRPEIRKRFAEEVRKYPCEYHGILFRFFDGRTVDEIVWKMVKPPAEKLFTRNEEAK